MRPIIASKTIQVEVLIQRDVLIAASPKRRGEPLYERAARAPLIVASNAKLLTTAAALLFLGPDFELRTVDISDVNDPETGQWRRLGSTMSPAAMMRKLGSGG